MGKQNGISSRSSTPPLQIKILAAEEEGGFKCIKKADVPTLLERLLIFAYERLGSRVRADPNAPRRYVQDAVNDLQFFRPPDPQPNSASDLYILLCRRIANTIRAESNPHSVTIAGRRVQVRHASLDDQEAAPELETATATEPHFENQLLEREFYAAKIDQVLDRLAARGVPRKTIARLKKAKSPTEIEKILSEFEDDSRTQKSGQLRIDAVDYAKAAGISERQAFRDLDEIDRSRPQLPPYKDFVRESDDEMN